MLDLRSVCSVAVLVGFFLAQTQGQAAPAAGSAVTRLVGPLVAQTSMSGREQQSSQVRFRARTWIKGGMALAALLAGMIAFFVKWMLRKGAETQSWPAPGSVEEQAFQPPVSDPSSPPATSPPVDKGTADSSGAAKSSPYGKPASPTSGVSVFTIVMLAALVVTPLIVCFLGVALVVIFWFIQSNRVQEQVDSLDELERSVVEVQQAPSEQAARRDWQAAFEQARARDFVLPETTFSAPGTEQVVQPPEQKVVTFPALPAKVAELPAVHWSASELSASGVILSRDGSPFQETSPQQGVLVGFRVTKDRRQLKSVQAIYQVGEHYELGEVLGQESDEERTQLLAEPGQVIAAVRLDFGFQIVGIQVAFAELKEGEVAWKEVTSSRFVGLEVKHNSVVIEGEGDVFAGVTGYARSGMDGLALRRVSRLDTCEVRIEPTLGMPRTQLPRAGGQAGTEFARLAPQGGVLVGMRFFVGRNWGGAIQGVQPIFQVGDQYHIGQRAGAEGGIMREVVARPGYAIGKIDVNAGLVLNSAMLTFCRVTPEGLDLQDTYQSQRYGSRGGGAFVLDSESRCLTGIGGTCRENLISLTAFVGQSASPDE